MVTGFVLYSQDADLNVKKKPKQSVLLEFSSCIFMCFFNLHLWLRRWTNKSNII